MDRKTEKNTVLSSQAVTANTNTSEMYVGPYAEALVFIDVTTITGTLPTCLPVVQVSHDNSSWWDHTAGQEMRDVVTKYLIPVSNIGDYIRVSLTVAGTSPSFTMSVVIQAKN